MRSRTITLLGFLGSGLAILSLLGGCDLFDSGHSEGPDPVSIPIDPLHQACQADSDCTLVYTDCSGCGCGEAVNLEYQAYYQGLAAKLCQDYSGPVCEVLCPKVSLVCQAKRCLAIPSPDS